MQLIMSKPGGSASSSAPPSSSMNKNKLFAFMGGGGGFEESGGFDINNFVYERSASWSSSSSTSSSIGDEDSGEFGPGSEFVLDRRKQEARVVQLPEEDYVSSRRPSSSSGRRRSSNKGDSSSSKRGRRHRSRRSRRKVSSFEPNECIEVFHRDASSSTIREDEEFNIPSSTMLSRRSAQLTAVLNHAGVAMEDFESLLNGVARML